ncbi:hypothetical protein [Achromobacter insolitus]|uniref:Uncharacterized protein n=1 Tax=Achromobacter insolitus TaxID=217204 RepID=A0A6S7F3Y7_9BURK|nr:hypothetical protein [Achromobacter insolitus]CAB3931658.1 hypothetical protein LMG6000_02264 [Achromobacter insolitus]CAB3939536.1 hypothetical protein LMG5997_04081 [Achromobacter insolitus]
MEYRYRIGETVLLDTAAGGLAVVLDRREGVNGNEYLVESGGVQTWLAEWFLLKTGM